MVLFRLQRGFSQDEYLAFTVLPGDRELPEPLVLAVDATPEGWSATTSTPAEVGFG
jgi:hypothetical protein